MTDTLVSVMEVGGTHVTAATVHVPTRSVLAGQCYLEPLNSDGSAIEILSAFVRCAQRLPGQQRWSIAVPGPFDYDRGIARYAGVGKFDALNGVDLRSALLPHLSGADHVTFHNDAHAYGIGEWWAGAARGHRSAVVITLGTGVGSCFLRDGYALQDGPGVPPQGRVDLLDYDGKPLEETVSRRALRRAYGHDGLDVREIAQLAQQGDQLANDVFTRAFRVLGTVLGPHIAEYAPEVVVIGGSIAASWDLVVTPLRDGLTDADARRTAHIGLVPARHPTDAPLLGAAYLAVEAGRDRWASSPAVRC